MVLMEECKVDVIQGSEKNLMAYYLTEPNITFVELRWHSYIVDGKYEIEYLLINYVLVE